MILKKSAVLYANGRPQNQAFGFAPIAMSLNFFTAVAELLGILLKLAENARLALINGFGLLVCNAANGRATKIGMKKSLSEVYSNRLVFLLITLYLSSRQILHISDLDI